MEKEKLEILLADMFDDLRTLNNNMLEQKQQIAQMQDKVCEFEKKVNKAAAPAADIKPIEAIINATSNELKQLIQQQSKPIIREWRFLLVPADYSK